jgi:hypothetical protein
MIVEPSPREIRRYGGERRYCGPPPPAGVGSRMLGPDAAAAPPGPPLAGLTLWLQRGTFAAGTWPDSSGNGFNAVGPGGIANPTPGLLNGRVSPLFNPAASQYLGVHGTVSAILGGPAANVWSLFVVFSYTGATAFGDATNTPGLIQHDAGFGEPFWGAYVGISGGILEVCGYNFEATGTTALVPHQTVGGPTVSTHFMSSIQNNAGPGSLATAIDGGAPTTIAGAAGVVILGGQTIAIGGDGNPPQGGPFWQGLIGEVLVYDVPLTGAALAQANAYMATF